MLECCTSNLTEGKAKVELKILEIDPVKVNVVIKVQEELKDAPGILREGTLAYTLAGRDKRIGGSRILDSTITYHNHISRFESNDPQGRKILGFVGNGNLLMNPWFVAWIEGELFHVKDEPVYRRKAPYSSLIVWRDGRVSIENIYFRGGKIKLDDPSGKDITKDVVYTTYGQRLVARGCFVLPYEISEQYYDLRHLLLFPFFSDQEGCLGLNQLEMDSRIREDALKKLPVKLDFRTDKDRAREALSEKNYQEVAKVEKEGQFRITEDKICIILKSGLFPHNIIGTTDKGRVVSIIVTGWSNTAGLMLDKASNLFDGIKEKYGLDIKDAILLDNGGDVMMYYRGKMIASSFMTPARDRLRSVVLFAAVPGAEEGIKLVEG